MQKTINTFSKTLWKTHPFLMKMGIFNAAIALFCLVAMGFDDRTLLGVSVWLKPLKFAISLAIFCGTITWLISIYPYTEKWRKWNGNFFAVLIFIEILTILIPASMGIKSHYNMSTLTSAIIFGVMGLAIHSTVLGLFIMAIQSFYKPLNTSKSIVWAIRFAWITMFFAFWGGELMIGQSAHNIGIPDGGDGLPITNWSTKGGDLRVMHFFGIHALQILPLLVYFLGQFSIFKTQKGLTTASILIGLGYLGLTSFLFYQALQGQPLFSF